METSSRCLEAYKNRTFRSKFWHSSEGTIFFTILAKCYGIEMDCKRTALFYIVLILKSSTGTPMESATPSLTSWNQTSSSHPTDLPPAPNDSIWNQFTIWGTVIGSVTLTAILLFSMCCLGFTSSGIRGGSLAADMMSYSALANYGGVPAGGYVANCQSIGALGICSRGCVPATAIIILGAGVGSLIGFGVGYGLNKLLNFFSYNDSPSDAPINSSIVSDAEYQVRLTSDGNRERRMSSKATEVLNVSHLENNITTSDASDLDTISLLPDPPASNSSLWNPFTIWGSVAGAVILTPIALCIPYCLGFASAGVRMGSVAARMMSNSPGGNVVTGSCIAIFQSIGALGVCSLGFVPIAIIISINAAIGFGVGYGVKLSIDFVKGLFSNAERDTPEDHAFDQLHPNIEISGNLSGEHRLNSKTLEGNKSTSVHSSDNLYPDIEITENGRGEHNLSSKTLENNITDSYY